MRFSSVIRLLASLALVVTMGACANYYGATRILSVPSGAEVINLEDGALIGTTPTLYIKKDSNDRRQTVIIRLKKDGYYDKTSSFWIEMRNATSKGAEQNAGSVEIELQAKDGQ
ncbi:MAG: hypothetical protein KJP04_04600 [Arenicella sp.]|nr:hypothetical protein [Arenicella sp.]